MGLGGPVAVVLAGGIGSGLGYLVRLASGEHWPGHLTTHVVSSALIFAIALSIGRMRRDGITGGLAERALGVVRVIALAVSATAFVEGIGAYPPLALLHEVVRGNIAATIALILSFVFVAGVGARQAIRARRVTTGA